MNRFQKAGKARWKGKTKEEISKEMSRLRRLALSRYTKKALSDRMKKVRRGEKLDKRA